MYLEKKIKFYSTNIQVLLNKICIRILSAPDPDPNQLYGSGSCQKVWILFDPDPQHCLFPFLNDFKTNILLFHIIKNLREITKGKFEQIIGIILLVSTVKP